MIAAVSPLLATALLAAGGFAAAEAGVDAEPAPDPAALIAEARRVQVHDLEAWRRFAFRRQVVRRRLDARGEVAFRQDLDFRVEPAADGFDETLVAIDGRAPSAREIREHRHEARFTRHYDHAREGKLGGVLGFGELDFGYIFRGLHYRYAGRETTSGGIACHRLAIEPLARDTAAGAADPLAAATAGDLWLAVDGLHVVRASTRLTRPVRQGLARVERLDLDFESQRAEGAWLPRRIELRSALGGLLRLRAHNIYTYSEFEGRRARGFDSSPSIPGPGSATSTSRSPTSDRRSTSIPGGLPCAHRTSSSVRPPSPPPCRRRGRTLTAAAERPGRGCSDFRNRITPPAPGTPDLDQPPRSGQRNPRLAATPNRIRSSRPFQRQEGTAMIKLYDSETGTVLGRISDEQFTFLEDHLEEESGEDRDYYFSAATIDALEGEGADAELVALLRRAVGDREGVEVRWERAD